MIKDQFQILESNFKHHLMEQLFKKKAICHNDLLQCSHLIQSSALSRNPFPHYEEYVYIIIAIIFFLNMWKVSRLSLVHMHLTPHVSTAFFKQ